jgi:hypothetical protein
MGRCEGESGNGSWFYCNLRDLGNDMRKGQGFPGIWLDGSGFADREPGVWKPLKRMTLSMWEMMA